MGREHPKGQEGEGRGQYDLYDPVYGLLGRTRGPWLTKTSEGYLLQWERGTRRYTLGWRHWLRFHRSVWPMTPLEIRRRGLTRDPS